MLVLVLGLGFGDEAFASVVHWHPSERAVSGALAVSSHFGARRTILGISGSLKARGDHVSVRVRACPDSACRPRQFHGELRALDGGANRLRKHFSLKPSAGVEVAVFDGAKRIARLVVKRPVSDVSGGPGIPEPGSGPPPGPGPGAPQPGPSPSVDNRPQPENPPPVGGETKPKLGGRGSATFSVDPALNPDYAPDVSDYVVPCDPREPVAVDAVASGGAGTSVDGGPWTSGTFHADIVLKPGQSFTVRTDDASGIHTHVVRCLPAGFPSYEATRSGPTSGDTYAVTLNPGGDSHWVAIFDGDGVPVWWRQLHGTTVGDAKALEDGTLAWGLGENTPYDLAASYEIHKLDGTRQAVITNPASIGTDKHDLEKTPDGNYLLIAYVPRDGVDLSHYGGPADATVLDAQLTEVSPTGSVIWSWNSAGHIATNESSDWIFGVLGNPSTLPDGRTAYDIVHPNAIAWDGDAVVFSARHLDAVYRIDRATGQIDWKLGGTQTPKSLKVDGDPFAPTTFSGQHDARPLGDGTLTVHENGSFGHRPPRVARYRIDPAAGTATLVSQFTDARAPTSFCCGGARMLADGHWVVSWGGVPMVTETTSTGDPVLTLQFSTFSYRANPIAPDVIDIAALRAGMDAQYPR